MYMPVDTELHENFDFVNELCIFWEYQSQQLSENWMQELDSETQVAKP